VSLQVLVDITIPRDVFTVVKTSLEVLLRAHSTEYTGANMVTSNFAGDPLKITLCVFWEYTHSGKFPSCATAGSVASYPMLRWCFRHPKCLELHFTETLAYHHLTRTTKFFRIMGSFTYASG
jgi:hypothetical protein